MNDRDNIIITASILLDRFFWFRINSDPYFRGMDKGRRTSALLLVGTDKKRHVVRERRKEVADQIRSNRKERKERGSKAA